MSVNTSKTSSNIPQRKEGGVLDQKKNFIAVIKWLSYLLQIFRSISIILKRMV